jgi:hypothetical protein
MTADGLKCTFTGDSVPGLDFTEKDDHGSANLDIFKANGKLCNYWPTVFAHLSVYGRDVGTEDLAVFLLAISALRCCLWKNRSSSGLLHPYIPKKVAAVSSSREPGPPRGSAGFKGHVIK